MNSAIHKIFELLQSIEEENNIIDGTKNENRKRISVKQQEILDFIASNDDSDSKSIAKAIGLRVPRTRDYLKDLIKMGEIEVSGDVRYKTYRIKKERKLTISDDSNKESRISNPIHQEF